MILMTHFQREFSICALMKKFVDRHFLFVRRSLNLGASESAQPAFLPDTKYIEAPSPGDCQLRTVQQLYGVPSPEAFLTGATRMGRITDLFVRRNLKRSGSISFSEHFFCVPHAKEECSAFALHNGSPDAAPLCAAFGGERIFLHIFTCNNDNIFMFSCFDFF
jgi:hypothetical protein